MSLVIEGKIQLIGDTQQVSDKFKKREFVLELEEEINGNVYTNYAKMQLVQSKCEILDRFKGGDMVKVSFNIKGNSYVDKKDGTTKYITNLDAWRIESTYSGTPQHGAPNQNIPNYSSSHTTNGGSGYAQPQNNAPELLDDLPF